MPNYHKQGTVDFMAVSSGGGASAGGASLASASHTKASLDTYNSPGGGSSAIHPDLTVTFTATSTKVNVRIEGVVQANTNDEASWIVMDMNNSAAEVLSVTHSYGLGWKRSTAVIPITVVSGQSYTWRLGHKGAGAASSTVLVSPTSPIRLEVTAA
jgi:hypothetical protein